MNLEDHITLIFQTHANLKFCSSIKATLVLTSYQANFKAIAFFQTARSYESSAECVWKTPFHKYLVTITLYYLTLKTHHLSLRL